MTRLARRLRARPMRPCRASLAIGHLRDIASAEEAYRSTVGGGNKYGILDELIGAGLLDYDGRKKNGYRFEAVATPLNYASSGYRSFYMSDNYVIHAADKKGREANADDPSIERSPYRERHDDPWSTY